MSTYTKRAFTLIELSVVIVIISIMLSTVLVSRSLIINAKVNKIQEEFRMFNGAFQMFYNTYDCYPGDCQARYIPDLAGVSVTASPYYNFLNAINGWCVTTGGATAPEYVALNTGMIESPTKRTCMMVELQASGYLNGININGISGMGPNASVLNTNTMVPLSASKPGVNVPTAKFSNQAVWDFRAVTGGTAPGTPTPIQTMYTSPALIGEQGGPFSFWAGYHVLVLHDNNLSLTNTGTTNSINTYIGNDIAYTSLPSNTAVAGSYANYAVSSSLAYRLDTKFDDGLPYSGNIAGMRNVVDAQTVVAGIPTITTPGYTCSSYIGQEGVVTLALLNSLTIPVAYQSTNSVKNGCMIAFIV